MRQAPNYTPEERLRRNLTTVRLAPAYQSAVDKAVAAGLAAFPDDRPAKQLSVARAVALKELAAFLGWDMQ